MSGKRGRPSKYARYVHMLRDGELYSAAKAVMELAGMEAFADIPSEEQKAFRFRMRVALNNRSRGLKPEGDGFITLHGYGPVKAYYGETWKDAYPLERQEISEHIPPNTPLSFEDLTEGTCQNSK